jgi:beta-lactamase class A
MTEHLTRRSLLSGGAATAALLVVPGTPAQAVSSGSLRRLERDYGGRIGAVGIDTGNGRTVVHRADERFPLLSTFKVLAAAAVLERARGREPGLLDRVLHWTADDLVENSPITEQHVADGLTVAQLCHAAIAYSDNTAGNLLLGRIGGPAGLTRYARALGDPATRLDRWETELNDWSPALPRDTTTPAAMARNLRALALGHELHHDDRHRLVGWLRSNTTGGARIRAGLPTGWTVGDKTGSSSAYGAANDIAVVHPPTGAPLILAVYTNRDAPDATYDNAVIASAATLLVSALGRL